MISSVFAPTTTRREDVGGKAASLFRLHALGCRVPSFFVVTADVARNSADGRLAPEARQEVLNAWQALGGDRFAYAIRSSGAAEDSAENSFAGVYETILQVREADAVCAAVERCWASQRSAPANVYRESRHVKCDDAMAVIVQRMVEATWSGVSFTADPTTQALSMMVVNAVQGLGERLVSGVVEPEELRIENKSGKLLERRIPAGKTPFPGHMLSAVVAESKRVAESLGFPQDLEWAFEGETLQLLQSRPITTLRGVFHNRALEPWGPDANVDDPQRVWTRVYGDEIWTPPVSPLFYDIQNLTGQLPMQLAMLGDRSGAPSDIFKYYRAAAYLDCAQIERLYAYQPRFCRLPTVLNLLPPERRESFRQSPWKWRGTLHKAWLFEISHGPRWGLTRNHKFLERSWPTFEKSVVPLLTTKLDSLDNKALDEHLNRIWTVAGSIGVECGITVFHYAHDLKLLLTALLERWCGDGEMRYGLVTGGLAGSHTVRETDAIWQIAQTVRTAGPDAVEAARACSWAESSERSPDQNITTSFNDFLARHGHRGANYKDPVYPRWGDNPELLWMQVKAFLGPASARPNEMNSRSASARIAAQLDALKKLRGLTAPLKRMLLRFLFRYNEIYVSLRDNHRFYYDQIWWLLRLVYLEKGKRLHATAMLQNPDDVFFLVRKEIGALEAGGVSAQTAQTRIAVRREEWSNTRRVQPPKYLRRGYVPDNEPAHSASNDHTLVGMAASAGQVRARARVLFDVTELGRMNKGEILVTRQTDPGWTPAFARLGGLVLETGGVLAHGASLCREFSVPCVTAVENATSRIGDGDLISVDGGLGTVEIVEKRVGPLGADA